MTASPGSADATELVIVGAVQLGGTVLAVHREDVPGGGPAAAILRNALGS